MDAVVRVRTLGRHEYVVRRRRRRQDQEEGLAALVVESDANGEMIKVDRNKGLAPALLLSKTRLKTKAKSSPSRNGKENKKEYPVERIRTNPRDHRTMRGGFHPTTPFGPNKPRMTKV